ncbi:hypothetical protein F-VV10_0138 [Faustovirus]|nr:hypothetical protein F-VV10_0138 [Faustovirus]
MDRLENQLKAAYYSGFEDDHERVKAVLDGATIDNEIWLLWLPHKPISNMIMQIYGGENIKIEAIW